MSEIDTILDAEKKQKAVFGTNQVFKQLKNGLVKEVYLSSNFPEDMSEKINLLAKETEVKIHELKMDNEELGVLCKKPFKVAAIGILGKE